MFDFTFILCPYSNLIYIKFKINIYKYIMKIRL